jgi:molecular chaperone GrpE
LFRPTAARVSIGQRYFSAEQPAADAQAPPQTPPTTEGEDLKAQLAKKDAEIKSLNQQHLLDLAEMENIRMRARRDVENERSFALSGFAKSLLDVSDNLQRAVDSAHKIPAEEREKNVPLTTMLEGVVMTQTQLDKTYAKYGVVKLNPVGEKFNANFHEAIVEVPDATKEPGTVFQVFKDGYTIKERLLRSAMVSVVRKP